MVEKDVRASCARLQGQLTRGRSAKTGGAHAFGEILATGHTDAKRQLQAARSGGGVHVARGVRITEAEGIEIKREREKEGGGDFLTSSWQSNSTSGFPKPVTSRSLILRILSPTRSRPWLIPSGLTLKTMCSPRSGRRVTSSNKVEEGGLRLGPRNPHKQTVRASGSPDVPNPNPKLCPGADRSRVTASISTVSSRRLRRPTLAWW